MSAQSTDRSPERQANRFEVTGGDQTGAGNVETALARNRAFAAAGGHEGAVVFPNLGLFVITCLDPRVDPAHFLGLQLSDAMVVRNVGGRVTPEVIYDVAYIAQIVESVLPDGPLFEVAVFHHTQCGAGALADDTFRRRYAERIGVDEADLRDHAVLDPAATVTRDVERLRSAAAVPGRVTVSGHVYDVVTGLVQTIVPARADAHQSTTQAERRPDPQQVEHEQEDEMDHLAYFQGLYEAFNRRDVDGVLAKMSDEVDWPNAWKGGRLLGRDAVRDYWTAQWAEIDPHVEPLAVTKRADGSLAVTVRQVVRSADGALLGDAEVVHVYRLNDGLIRRMDVEEPEQ